MNMHDLSISQQLNTTLADVSHTNQHNTKQESLANANVKRATAVHV